MENVFFYLIKSSGLIATFLIAYYFLLCKETFFKSNRWFLLFGLVTSVVLPLVTFKKIILIEAAKQYEWANLPIVGKSLAPAPLAYDIDWYLVLTLVYAIGLFVLVFKFVFDFRNLVTILKGQTVQQQADFKFIDVKEKVAPFSYFNYIVYNSTLYSATELENILEHEKVHCEQKHSIDVLVSRVFCILFWYNPFVWFYQKAMLQNLEFIADNEALKTISDKKAYQITLLKVTAHQHCVAISNHFYQSLIKKRIVMLNKNQSKKWNSWKYFIMVPVLAAFLFYFQVKVIAQEKNLPAVAEKTQTNKPIAVVINKNTTDEELKKESELWRKEHNIKLKFSKLKRNSSGEIVAIKVEFKDAKGAKGVSQYSSNEPIKPIRLSQNDDGVIGFGNAASPATYAYHYDSNSDNTADENETVTVYGDDVEAPESPEIPEVPIAPEATEMPEPLSPPDTPLAPKAARRVKSVTTRRPSNGENVIRVVANGKVIEVYTDKMIADLAPILSNSLWELDEQQENIDLKEIKRITRDALRKARKSIHQSAPETEDALREAEHSGVDLEDARREMEKVRDEMQQAKAELEKSRAALEKAKAEAKRKK